MCFNQLGYDFMKALAITILMTFSTMAVADDFYTRYLQQAGDCENQARHHQQMSTFFHCISGAIRTIKGDPYLADNLEHANLLIIRNTKRAQAWEQFENWMISETELNETLGKIDRNE